MISAVIGTGNIGHVHIEVMEKLHLNIGAICDIRDEAMSDFSYPKYNDYKKMIEEIRPDVVHICTPHYLHFEMAKYCLERNINVIIEKPIAINEKDLDELIEIEKHSKAQAAVSFQTRYNHAMVFVKEYLKEHKPVSGYATLIWNRGKDYYSSGEWRGKWATEGGGVLINQTIHTIDFMISALGEPKSILANVSNLDHPYIEVEDNAFVLAKGAIPFTIMASTCAIDNFENQVVIKTIDSVIRIVGQEVFVDNVPQNVKKEELFYGKACYGRGHEYLFEDFYRCVKEGKKYFLDIKEASKANRFVLRTYQSQGKEIKF